jgi:hypothetical protein
LKLPRDELRELLAVVARYRWRLGAEVVLRFVLRGLIVGAVLLTLLSIADWLFELGVQQVWLWSALLLPTLGALGLALALWPSERQAARVADHRLQLDERVGTAVELGRRAGHSGRFDHLQLQDAIAQAARPRGHWSVDVSRREVWVALAAAAIAALSLLLDNVPPPRFEQAAEAPTEAALVADERTVPPEVLDIPGLDSVTIGEQTAEADLAPRVRQAQAEQEALDRLAQALGQVSAGQSAADAIQRGDFGDARSQLSALGEEADQLSDAAKKQLAQALQSAASASPADRQLADRERQAAVALSRNSYADQRNALRNLGEQVERSGARSVPAAQLARDAGRLQQQQQQGNNAGQGQGANQAPPASSIQAQQGAGEMSGAQGGMAPTGADAGEQGGVGAGTGTSEGVGDPASRLANSGQLVEVPQKLGAGPGMRPTDGTEDQVGTDPSVTSRTAVEAAQTQQTGHVTPEQNLVPGDQRPVVRGYFR